MLPSRIKLTEDEISLIPSTFTPQFETIARSATNTLVEVGWFIKEKDRWYISDEGRAASRALKNLEDVFKAALALCEEKQQLRANIQLTVENAEEKAWQQIWHYLNEMNPVEFRGIVSELLKALNYQLDWIAPPGKNHGYIDMVAYPNPIGSPGPRVKVHVRHRGQPATVEGLRAFMGELSQNDLGIFVSSGGFTDQVLEAARIQELRNIRLVSLHNFIEFWEQNYDKISREGRQHFPLKPVYFLEPDQQFSFNPRITQI